MQALSLPVTVRNTKTPGAIVQTSRLQALGLQYQSRRPGVGPLLLFAVVAPGCLYGLLAGLGRG